MPKKLRGLRHLLLRAERYLPVVPSRPRSGQARACGGACALGGARMPQQLRGLRHLPLRAELDLPVVPSWPWSSCACARASACAWKRDAKHHNASAAAWASGIPSRQLVPKRPRELRRLRLCAGVDLPVVPVSMNLMTLELRRFCVCLFVCLSLD